MAVNTASRGSGTGRAGPGSAASRREGSLRPGRWRGQAGGVIAGRVGGRGRQRGGGEGSTSRGGGAITRCSIGVDDEAGEGAVFVAVAAVRFASVELDEDLVARVQVQDHAVAGVVVVLVCVLGNGAGPHLRGFGVGGVRGAREGRGKGGRGTVRGKAAARGGPGGGKAPLPASSGVSACFSPAIAPPPPPPFPIRTVSFGRRLERSLGFLRQV